MRGEIFFSFFFFFFREIKNEGGRGAVEESWEAQRERNSVRKS